MTIPALESTFQWFRRDSPYVQLRKRIPPSLLLVDHVLAPRPWFTSVYQAWDELPDGATFQRGRTQGLELLETFGKVEIDPYFVMFIRTATESLWAYTGLRKAYTIGGTSHYNITRQTAGVDVDYNASPATRWSGVGQGDLAYFTNGVDVPQVWSLPGISQRLIDLPNWPAFHTAKIIRAFGPYLLALGYTEMGVYHPQRLRWSHPADPGSVPISWDIADETKDTGQVDIGSPEHGPLTDAAMLDKICMLYQQEAIYQMRLIGGSLIFDVSRPMSQEVGAIAQDCVKPFRRNLYHFCAGPEDLVIVSVNGVESVADRKVRRWLYQTIDTTNYVNSFVVHNLREREMWFCFPPDGETECMLALVWNYLDATYTVRDLAKVRYGNSGVILPPSEDDTWDKGEDATWDAGKDIVWDSGAHETLRRSLLFTAKDVLLQVDEGLTFNGTPITFHAERTDIAIVGRDRQGNWKSEPRVIKMVTEVWIKATGQPFTVTMGTQEAPRGSVTWAEGQTFDPATQHYLNFIVSGRLLAIKFTHNGPNIFEISGWSLRVAILGNF